MVCTVTGTPTAAALFPSKIIEWTSQLGDVLRVVDVDPPDEYVSMCRFDRQIWCVDGGLNASKPAGLDASIGVVTADFVKQPGDQAWDTDPEMVAFLVL